MYLEIRFYLLIHTPHRSFPLHPNFSSKFQPRFSFFPLLSHDHFCSTNREKYIYRERMTPVKWKRVENREKKAPNPESIECVFYICNETKKKQNKKNGKR